MQYCHQASLCLYQVVTQSSEVTSDVGDNICAGKCMKWPGISRIGMADMRESKPDDREAFSASGTGVKIRCKTKEAPNIPVDSRTFHSQARMCTDVNGLNILNELSQRRANGKLRCMARPCDEQKQESVHQIEKNTQNYDCSDEDCRHIQVLDGSVPFVQDGYIYWCLSPWTTS